MRLKGISVRSAHSLQFGSLRKLQTLFVSKDLGHFFGPLLRDAFDRQRLSSRSTFPYLVDMLVEMSLRSEGEVSLVQRILGTSDVLCLKEAGDEALFVSGFYPERVERLRMSVEYYESLGSMAYMELSSRFSPALRPVFFELSRKMPTFRRVVSEVRRACDRMSHDTRVTMMQVSPTQVEASSDILKIVSR